MPILEMRARDSRLAPLGEVRGAIMATNSVLDVAAYILRQRGPMSAMKLQKLVYYTQAGSLMWDGKPLFKEEIKAWANGPVVPELFQYHRGVYEVTQETLREGDASKLDSTQAETVDAVLRQYGDKSPQWLSDLSHSQAPWRDAYGNRPAGMRCNETISLDSIEAYYSSLMPDEE